MSARALILAAPASGAGKTTLTLALLAAFAGQGVAVRGAKIGPDYIDPAFHAALTGREAFNLDLWAMGEEGCAALLHQAAEGAELLLIEAAMGLFDGVAGSDPRRPAGSAAALAARFRLPVVLVLDARGMGQSAAALARGFCTHDPEVEIAGVILNQVASPRHRALLEAALAAHRIPCFGALPRRPDLALPARHLGLVQASEQEELPLLAARLAREARDGLDLAALAASARPLGPPPPRPRPLLRPPARRIAIARDAAFSFVYPHLLAAWRAGGAELSFFSPLADEGPEERAELCWLPGGYPELHAARLAAARHFQRAMRHFAATRPVHGECGGFMVLGRAIEDAAGVKHGMLGLLDFTTRLGRRPRLGYRRARLLAPHPLGPAGARFRGHEFHYAEVTTAGETEPLFALADGEGQPLGPAGFRRGLVSGSFFHLIAEEEEEDAHAPPPPFPAP
jgi:cobyrinic acid a,c-diamide synthase